MVHTSLKNSQTSFNARLGILRQNQSIKIYIIYVTELNSDQIHFILPTAVAPRYGDLQKDSLLTDMTKLLEGNPTYSSETKYTLDMKVTCRMTASLLSVESPSHKITTEINLNGDPKACRVGLAEDSTRLEKDFVLIVKSQDLDKPRYG